MKKTISFILFCLVALMMITGCASSSTGEETKTIETPQTLDINKENDVFSKALANKEGTDLVSRDYGQGLHAADGNPSLEDFNWFEDLIYSGLPENIYYPKVKYIEGIWKYRIRVRRDSSTDGFWYDEIGVADLSLDYENVELIINLHPQLGASEYEAWPLTDEEIGYEEFRGGFNDQGGLTLSGNGLLADINEYYEYEGKEYIIGSLYTPQDYVGDFLFLRD
ncbi:MAG: hypothetical protein J6S49_01850 [Erysipelotrichaceae bacterium]|nr:hypothetical protein [Erysipelotrichaceae bacterium]